MNRTPATTARAHATSDTAWKTALLAVMSQGSTITEACALLDIDRTRVWRISQTDGLFKLQLKEARRLGRSNTLAARRRQRTEARTAAHAAALRKVAPPTSRPSRRPDLPPLGFGRYAAWRLDQVMAADVAYAHWLMATRWFRRDHPQQYVELRDLLIDHLAQERFAESVT